MTDLKENLSPPYGSNFMMLPEYLHSLFIRYIKDGRIRAPPEYELGDLIQTFQQGAKTDRRALQSKFKSWAKRMEIENNNLKLSSTGKIIIPKEKCDDLVMSIHSEKHISLDKVIHKIQEKYTWTRKNFGMDREIVIDTISNKCRNEECRQKLGLSEGTRFYQGPSYMMPNPLMFGTPPFYNWQPPFALRTLYSSNANHFESPFYPESYLSMEKPYSMPNFTDQSQKNSFFPQNDLQYIRPNVSETSFKNETDFTKMPLIETPNQNETASFVRSLSKYCGIKKPRNIHEYNALMKASKRYPEAYPSVLKNQKTKFLASFGLVPKGLCSSKTLRKFRRECKRKRIVEERCVRYLECKVLRDRNKLNKRSFHEPQRKGRWYLKADGSSKAHLRSMSMLSSKRQKQNYLERLSSDSEDIKIALDGDSGDEMKRKINANISLKVKERSPEIIDIASDEEEKHKKLCQSGLTIESDHKSAENQEKKIVRTQDYNRNQEEFSKRYPFHRTLSTYENESLGIFGSQDNNIYQNSIQDSSVFQSGRNSMFKRRDFQQYPLLQPYLASVNTSENVAVVPSTSQGHNKPIPGNQTNSSLSNYHKHKINFASKPATNLLVPRQFTPIILKHDTSIPVSKQKDSPGVTYNYPIRQSPSETKVFLVDRLPKGAIVILPSYRQQILPKGLNISKGISANRPIAPRQMIAQTTSSIVSPRNESLNADKDKTEKKEEKGDGNSQRKNETRDVKQKDNINEEMRKLLMWISKMKLNIRPQMFNRGLEKTVQRLSSQLNVGISLVREVRNALLEIEKYEYVEPVNQV